MATDGPGGQVRGWEINRGEAQSARPNEGEATRCVSRTNARDGTLDAARLVLTFLGAHRDPTRPGASELQNRVDVDRCPSRRAEIFFLRREPTAAVDHDDGALGSLGLAACALRPRLARRSPHSHDG